MKAGSDIMRFNVHYSKVHLDTAVKYMTNFGGIEDPLTVFHFLLNKGLKEIKNNGIELQYLEAQGLMLKIQYLPEVFVGKKHEVNVTIYCNPNYKEPDYYKALMEV